jgi:hypothetical protein
MEDKEKWRQDKVGQRYAGKKKHPLGGIHHYHDFSPLNALAVSG